MQVVMRADASTAIGVGHVMRCLTLADGLRKSDVTTEFICRTEPGNVVRQIRERGYTVHELPPGINASEDRDMTLSVLKKSERTADWLIVDHYGLDKAFESALRPAAHRIMVIDDLADRIHDCDLLLDQNYGGLENRYDSLIPSSCTKTIGTTYALVRADFIEARETAGIRRGPVHRILVFFGGSDGTNETAKTLRALQKLGEKGLSIDVVIGPSNTNRAEIEKTASLLPSCRCHVDIPSLAELMASADLAIGAGGSSMWERCCAGLPTLAVTIAANQVALTEALAQDGYIIAAGSSSSATEETLYRDIEFLIAHPEIVHNLSKRSRDLVDGKGVDRIVHLLTAAARPTLLRPAEERDCRTVFDWRNHPAVIAASFDTRPLKWDAHQHWFAQTLRTEDRVLLIAEIDQKPVGVIRYDFLNDEAIVSIYVDPDRFGSGVGPDILRTGTEWIRLNRRSIKRIIAEVRPGNEASIRAFRKARFQDHHCTFQLELQTL